MKTRRQWFESGYQQTTATTTEFMLNEMKMSKKRLNSQKLIFIFVSISRFK